MGDTKQTVRTRTAGGGELVRTPEEIEALAGTGEAPLSSTDLAAEAATAGAQRRRDAFDNAGDAALTFAEGVIDALTLGLIHETGPAAELRRDVNSGEALLGNLVGTGIGVALPVGPVAGVLKGGKSAGQAAARAILGEAEAGSRAAIAAKTIEGASEMAAFMGAASLGHQVTDAVIGDKPFAATAVIHEAGLGALLGGGVSFLSGVFGRAASKYEVRGQGDLLDAGSATSKAIGDHVGNARRAWDEALSAHEQRLGVLKQLEAEGLLDATIPEFLAQRELALAEARGLQKEFAALDFEAALAGSEKEYSRWVKTMETYEAKLKALDEAMTPKTLERLKAREVGPAPSDPGAPVTENLGLDMEEVARMDDLMRNPENAAAYEQLYGRPYTPQAQYAEEVAAPRRAPSTSGGTPMQRPGRAARESFDRSRLPLQPESPALASEGAAPLGRAPLPGRMKLQGYEPTSPPLLEGPPPAVEAGALPVRAPGGYSVSGYRGTGPLPGRMSPGGATVTGYGGRTAGVAPAGMAAKAAPAEVAAAAAAMEEKLVAARAAAEAGVLPETRAIEMTEQAAMMDNALSGAYPDLAKTQYLGTDGYFMTGGRIADARQNAEAFSMFRQKALGDTPIKQRMSGDQLKALNREYQAMQEAKLDLPEIPGRPTNPERIPTPVEPTDVRPMDGTTQLTSRERLRRTVKAQQESEGKAAVRRYLDEWYATAEMQGPRFSPGDYAAQELKRSTDEMMRLAGGRDIAAGSTDLARALKLPEPTTRLGAQLNDLYVMRKLADLAADASKGTAIRGVGKNNPLLQWVVRRSTTSVAGRMGSKAVSAAIGHTIGGPVGYFAAAAMANSYLGFAGRAAGAAGRLYQRSLKAASSLLSGRRSTYAAAALAPNRPIAYSEQGPIKDPVRRIEELRRVASSPGTMADFVAKAAGDLNLVSPAFVEAAVMTVTAQLQFLAEMAPPLRYDRLGRPMPPSAGAIRRFLEAENAVFNLEAVLGAVASGSVTKVQVEALRRAHGPVYTKMAAFLLDDPAKLAQLDRAKLATVQMVVGAPLTPGADPEFTARQQMGWPPEQAPGTGGPAQALSIPGAQKGGGYNPRGPTSPSPTPSQSFGTSGRAPGN